jgi:WhiB family redox-sensing transcriptional regulator
VSHPAIFTEFVEREPWRARAACRGAPLSAFFPKGRGQDTSARALCNDCPVLDECLESALRLPRQCGWRAGMSEKDRTALGRA